MRREGKARPFIPSEVRAHTGPARATTPAVARRRHWATIAVGAWAKASPLGRRRLCPGGNACAQARTHARGRQRVPHGRGVFSQTPQTSVLGRRRLCAGGNACARARTHAPRRERMRPGDNVCARVTTGAAWEGCFFTNTPNFRARATTSTSGRQRLRPSDDVRTRATTS